MAPGWFEDGATTLDRNERRKARQEQAKAEDKAAAKAQLRGRRSI